MSVLLSLCAAFACAAQEPVTSAAPGAAEVVPLELVAESMQRSVDWLTAKQNPDGSWGDAAPASLHELNYSPASFRHWQLAGGAISLWAFLQSDAREADTAND